MTERVWYYIEFYVTLDMTLVPKPLENRQKCPRKGQSKQVNTGAEATMLTCLPKRPLLEKL